MDGNMTFGSFLKEKRTRMDFSMKDLAEELGVSAVYICDVEKDRKLAPKPEYLAIIAEVLKLNVEERNLMYDLAAVTKAKQKAISLDLPDYIMEKDVVRTALRTAKQYNIEDDEWLEFIEKIKEKDRTAK